MRWLAILALFWSAGTAAAAPDCTFEAATYSQPNGWTVQFQPVPRRAPVNQSASFILTLKSGVELQGRIGWPNGYSTPLWNIEGLCQPDGTELCQFTEGKNNAAYVLTGSGMEQMPHDMSGPPPRQILLPGLGSSLWYSWYRETEFDDDPGDVLTLSGCG